MLWKAWISECRNYDTIWFMVILWYRLNKKSVDILYSTKRRICIYSPFSTLRGCEETIFILNLVVCFYTDVIALPIKIVLMMIALSVFCVGVYVAMWGGRKIGYFKCRNCNELFTPTFMQYNYGNAFIKHKILKMSSL